VEHRGLKNLIAWHQRTYGITSRDVSTLVASPGFDASVWEIWPYLSSGAAIAIPEEDVRITPDRLVEWLAANDVTLSFLPTPLAEAVLNHTWPGDTRFRALLTGGDVLHPVRQTNLSFRIYNHYGPTEGAVVATFGEVSAGENAMPSIGRPIDNTEAYILDMNQQPVPIGVPGELYIAGAGVARGYRNQPQLTGERFVANPLRNSPWKRAYRTGDSCRFLGDGRIQFEGRQDTQIKIRGFRVELGEIESLIAQEPGVGECAVALRTTSESRQAALVAYFVATTRQSAPTPPQLRRALSAKLPQYMIPQIFVLLDALPKSASGKIDRSALPKAEMPSGGNEESREVRTRAEQLMAEAWKEVLGVKTLGSEDNFFDLGGNSLLAVQVVRRVQRVSGASINPLILLSGTLAQAAEALEQTLERSTRGPAYGWRRWMSALMQNIGRPKR
jgi:acyl-coenzyme A synthetase/AMP-(fatty) acid ligase